MLIRKLRKNEMAISRKVNRVSPDLFGYVDYCIQNNSGVVGYETIDGNQIVFISSTFIANYILSSSETSDLVIIYNRLQNYFKKIVNLSNEEKYDYILSGEFLKKIESLLKKQQDQLDIISNSISELFDEVKSYNENLGFEFNYNETSQSESINKDYLRYVRDSRFYQCERNGYGDLFLTDKTYHDVLRWSSKYYLLRDFEDDFCRKFDWYKTKIYVAKNLNRLVSRFRGINAPLLVCDVDLNVESLDAALLDLRRLDFDKEYRGTRSYSNQTLFDFDLKFDSKDGVECNYTLNLMAEFDSGDLHLKLYSDSQEFSGNKLEN